MLEPINPLLWLFLDYVSPFKGTWPLFFIHVCIYIHIYVCVCIYNIGIYIMYVLPIYLNLCAVYLYIYVCIFNNIYECADGVSVCILSL